jgi:hypothetical protein
MRKVGLNTFSVSVEDVSGNQVSGLLSGWTYRGALDATPIVGGSITPIENPSAPGWYHFEVDLPVPGEGFIEFRNASAASISPPAYDLDVNIYSTDDIYAVTNRVGLNINSLNVSVYETSEVGPYKEGDDWVLDYTIPDSITTSISGWTNWRASIRNETSLVDPVSGYIGDFVISNINVASKSMTLTFAASATKDLVPLDQEETTVYSDLQALTNNALKKTVAEFAIGVRRQFTRDA